MSVHHLEASIAAIHCTEADARTTDWPRILQLYDQLLALTGSPVTAMNRAVAVGRVEGPQTGLAALDQIRQRSLLEANHLYHAIRGKFTSELGKLKEAISHFRQAAKLAMHPIEREFIEQRIRECERETRGQAVKVTVAW